MMVGLWDVVLVDGEPTWPRLRATNPGESGTTNIQREREREGRGDKWVLFRSKEKERRD